MRSMSLRCATGLVTGLGLVIGPLALAAVPAQAASFSVDVSVSRSVVEVGDTVTISGKVSPTQANRYVYLQRRWHGSSSWHTIRRVRTTRSRRFSIKVTAASETDRYYRVRKPAQSGRKAGNSDAVLVVVDPIASTEATLTGLTPASGPLSGGTTIIITGTGLAGTSSVTFTPQAAAADTKDGSGVLPAVEGTVTVVDDNTVSVQTPASLGGENLVTVDTPSGTVTSTFTYATTARAADAFEEDILTELNTRRAEQQTCSGKSMPAVDPLVWDEKLADLALSHSSDLADRQDLYKGITHVTWGTSGTATRFSRAGVTGAWGEILALSPESYTATKVVDQWMASTSGHCESVMNSAWTTVGVGVADGVWESSYGAQDSIFSNADFQ